MTSVENLIKINKVPNQLSEINIHISEFKKQKDYYDLTVDIIRKVNEAILFSMSQKNTKNITIKIHCEKVKRKNLDIKYLYYIAKSFQDLFPDVLKKAYIVNSPKFFKMIFEGLKIILAKDTYQKFQFI